MPDVEVLEPDVGELVEDEEAADDPVNSVDVPKGVL